MPKMQFEGQAVLVTGGGSGLGRGLIEAFLEEGAKVGVIEVSSKKGAALRSDLDPDRVEVIEGDVREAEVNREAVGRTVARFGRLDSFIQCAGICDYQPSICLVPEDALEAAYRQVMDVNVLGPIHGARAAAPELRKTGGSMVMTLSTAAFSPGGPHGLYIVAKHALAGAVKQLAYELAPSIRVNAVTPGPIRESQIGGPQALGQAALTPSDFFPEIETSLRESTPLGIYPSARDYAPIYLLLADRERNRIATGSLVTWDIGITLAGHGMGAAHALRAGAFGSME